MKRFLIFSPVLLLFACGAPEAPIRVDYKSLVTSPEKYAGRRIEVEGIFAMGFESMLFEDPENRIRSNIWFEYDEYPKKKIKNRGFDIFRAALAEAPNTGAWDTERILKVKVIARFEHEEGARYGHLNSYPSQLSVERFLEAIPCPKEPNKQPDPMRKD